MTEGVSKSFAQVATCGILGLVYIISSSAMIQFNKWMMVSDDHFPFPDVLCTIHMLVSSVLSVLFYLLFPTMYTAMPTVVVNRAFIAKFMVIGVAFAASLVLSNAAYKYNSVAFIQMLKQGNIVLTFVLSIAFGLEKYMRTAAFILAAVILGACTSAYGEINFSVFGVGVQFSSQIFEVIKIVLMNTLMARAGTKLDPLTTVFFMAPVCMLFCGAGAVAHYYGTDGFVRIMAQAHSIWPLLLLNALLAFFLNIIVALQIALFNSLGFLLAGICKDVAIVLVSAWIMGESVTWLQFFGFNLALLGIITYSLFKMHPECFRDDHLILGFDRVFQKARGGKPELVKHSAEKFEEHEVKTLLPK